MITRLPHTEQSTIGVHRAAASERYTDVNPSQEYRPARKTRASFCARVLGFERFMAGLKHSACFMGSMAFGQICASGALVVKAEVKSS